MGRRFRVTLRGTELGELPAGDFAEMILGVERVLHRAAGHVLGRPVGPTGRHERVIETAVNYRLIELRRGSVLGVFELPAQSQETGLGLDVPTLGEMALEEAAATAAGRRSYPDVAAAWVELIEQLGVGQRLESICLDPDANNDSESVVLDLAARDRLRRVAQPRVAARDDTLLGVLVEADFENRTARLRPLAGGAVRVSFSEDLAPTIKDVLRERSALLGRVLYDPRTHHARSVEVQQVVHGDQLVMGLDTGSEFAVERPLEDLAREQGVSIIIDPRQLHDPTVTDEEADAFLAALGIDS